MSFSIPLCDECSNNINIIKWLEYLMFGVAYLQVIEPHIVDLVVQFRLDNLHCWKSSFNGCCRCQQYQSQLNEFIDQWKYQMFLNLNHLHSQTLKIFTIRKGSMPFHLKYISVKLLPYCSTVIIRKVCIINISKTSKLINIKLGERVLGVKTWEAIMRNVTFFTKAVIHLHTYFVNSNIKSLCTIMVKISDSPPL